MPHGLDWGVKANIKAPHRFMRHGALVWVYLANPGWAGERVMVRGLSRGGRWVQTWIDARDLANFRAGWTHQDLGALWPTRDDAQAWADSMNERFGEQPARPHAAAFGRPGASNIQ